MKLKKSKSIRGGENSEVDWITVKNGEHIPMIKGESKQNAIDRHFIKGQDRNSDFLDLPKREYAELCSAVRTKFANKIPERGNIVYNNYFYMYYYNVDYGGIRFMQRIQMDRNEPIIAELQEEWE